MGSMGFRNPQALSSALTFGFLKPMVSVSNLYLVSSIFRLLSSLLRKVVGGSAISAAVPSALVVSSTLGHSIPSLLQPQTGVSGQIT